MKPINREVSFEACFEGLNIDHYKYCLSKSIKRSHGYGYWLEDPVNTLTKANRAEYVATTVKRILSFLQIESCFW